MQLPYFYEPEINVQSDQYVLGEESSKHAIQVLRMREGEQLQLTNGNGLLVTATILTANKKNTIVQLVDKKVLPHAHKNICLAIAPTKNISRIEWLLEKVTEIGIRKIVLLQTKRTEKTHIKTERLQHIVVSAMLQSRQVYLPELIAGAAFEHVIKENNYTEKYIAHCADDADKTAIKNIHSKESKIILIGPEGDFTQEEIHLASEAKFQAVSLGETRLRTETAGLVAAVLLLM